MYHPLTMRAHAFYLAGRGLDRTGGLQEEHHGSVWWRETVPDWDGDRPLPRLHSVTFLPGNLPYLPHCFHLPTSWCNLMHVWPLTSLQHSEWRQNCSWKHKMYCWPCCFSSILLRLFFLFLWDCHSDDNRNMLCIYLFDFAVVKCICISKLFTYVPLLLDLRWILL